MGMAAQYVFEDMADIPVRVELASEFRYRKMPLNQKALVIVISQSVKQQIHWRLLEWQRKEMTTLAIVNVVRKQHCTRSRQGVLYTCRSEISVATTKPTVHSLLQCTAWQCSSQKSEEKDFRRTVQHITFLRCLPSKNAESPEDKERIQWFAAKYAGAHDVFFVGRGIDYAVCLEGSLKLKEISLISILKPMRQEN